MKFSPSGIKLPSRNLQIDFMFLVGSFLFLKGESLYGNLFISLYLGLDLAFFFMFLGLGLFGTCLFLWNSERRRGSRAGLGWEALTSGSLSLILIYFFALYPNVAQDLPFSPILQSPLLLFLLGLSLVLPTAGILGYRSARMRAGSDSLHSVYIASRIPYRRARISTAFIFLLLAFMVFLTLPIFSSSIDCVRGVATILTPFLGLTFGCF